MDDWRQAEQPEYIRRLGVFDTTMIVMEEAHLKEGLKRLGSALGK